MGYLGGGEVYVGKSYVLSVNSQDNICISPYSNGAVQELGGFGAHWFLQDCVSMSFQALPYGPYFSNQKCPLSLTNGPFKFQQWASMALKARSLMGSGALTVRSLSGFSHLKLQGMASITIFGHFWNYGLPIQRRRKRAQPPLKENLWRTFLASKKNFPGRWWIPKPYKSQETISTTEISPLWTPVLPAKRSSALEQGSVWFLFGCGFFAYSWKLPAYSGAFLLTIDNFSFSAYSFSFFAYSFSFFTYSWSFFAYSGKVRLIRALRDCKQRSLTVSKKAPTVSKRASPFLFLSPAILCFATWWLSRKRRQESQEQLHRQFRQPQAA